MAAEPACNRESAESLGSQRTNGAPSLVGASARSVPADAQQGRVLADMSHELGNLFHRLYYWAEYLRDERAASNGDGTATEMLERTIKHLEEFLKVALEYFTPVEVNTIRVNADDVLTSFVAQLTTRMCGLELDVKRPASAAVAEVLVDPARLSQALEIAVRRVGHCVGEGSGLKVGVDCGTYAQRPAMELRISIKRPSEDSPFFRSAEAGVEWALLEKLMQLHGGGVQQHTPEEEERGFSLFIPTTAQ